MAIKGRKQAIFPKGGKSQSQSAKIKHQALMALLGLQNNTRKKKPKAPQPIKKSKKKTKSAMKPKFIIGQTVEFIDNNGYVPDYVTESAGIPSGFFRHGSTRLAGAGNPAVYVAKLEAMYDKYFIVSYNDEDGRRVQLAFNESAFKNLKQTVKTPSKIDLTQLDSLIISDDVKKEIGAVLRQHQNHKKLFEEWGLGSVIEYGKGMSFLFWGTPGTGKTWAAHCIAKALGVELLIVSAAEVQSSEPGGANRAIQNAFKEAKESNKVLFLDECDSLISSRADLGMVLAGEVNTLLTELEKFEGVAVLATNRVEHMDEALERRIALIVEFPFPKRKERIAIWKRMLPKQLPLGKGVDVEELADEKLSGGQIKNVVLGAARLALSEESDVVTRDHFMQAIARVNKSKNLLGTASNYRQPIRGVVGRDKVNEDVDVDVDVTKEKVSA